MGAAAILCCLLLGQGAWAESGKFYRVGFAQDTFDNDWRLAQVHELRRAMESLPNVELIVTNANGHTAQQIADIEDLLHLGIDILITSPRDTRAMTPVIERVFSQGIPVILLTRQIDSDAYTTFIAPDDKEIARRAARYLADTLKGEGRVVMLRGVPTTSTAQQRTEGFLEVIDSYPKIEVVAQPSANYLRVDAIVAMEEVLHEGIVFDSIYAQSDSMASGARTVLQNRGFDTASMATVGIDYIPEAREAIRNGLQSASFTYPTCAREAVEVVGQLIAGERPPRHLTVESTLVTRDNVEHVEPVIQQ